MSITLAIIITLNQSTYAFNESDGNIQVEVNLSNPAFNDIVIYIQHRNITAFSKFKQYLCCMCKMGVLFSGGVDYDSVPENITFPAGITSRLINITLIDDNIFEDTKSFSITLQIDPVSLLPINITNDTAVVFILNDDGKYNCQSVSVILPYPSICTFTYITVSLLLVTCKLHLFEFCLESWI